jgi:hypothetical protein
LAHVLKDRTEAAYQRGDMFAKRSTLMQRWADFVDQPITEARVLPLALGLRQ